MQRRSLASLLLALVISSCGDSSQSTADVVQAASKAAADSIQHAIESLDLSQMTPEAAKAKVQELLDRAGQALAEAKDSEMVQQAIAVLEALLDRLKQLGHSLAANEDVQRLQAGVQEQIQRFRDDPRVQGALKTLQEKLSQLTR